MPTTPTTLKAEQFYQLFRTRTQTAIPTRKSAKAWTDRIFPILHDIGVPEEHIHADDRVRFEKDIFHVRRKCKNKEYRRRDFTYFSREAPYIVKLGDDIKHYLPLITLEHENEPSPFFPSYKPGIGEPPPEQLRRILVDFRNLWLDAVPLRVAIGYATDAKSIDGLGETITSFYDTYQFKQVAEGETLVIIGAKCLNAACHWRAWLKRGDESWMTKDK